MNTASYDAFLSYSHAADSRTAAGLQITLERFESGVFGRRRRRLFRDATAVEATSSLPQSIRNALRASRFFILLACRASAQSVWVRQEVDFWLTECDPDASRLLIAWTGDEIVTRGPAGFDADRTTALPPAVVVACRSTPYFCDLRGARDSLLPLAWRRGLRDEIAKLLAPIAERRYEELRDRDRKRMRRRYIAAIAAGAVVATFAIVAVAERSRAAGQTRIAEEQARIAGEQTRLAEQNHRRSVENAASSRARESRLQLESGNPLTAIREALAVLPSNPASPVEPYMAQAEAALYRAIRAYPGRVVVGGGTTAPMGAVELDASGTRLLTASLDDRVALWNAIDGRELSMLDTAGAGVLDVGFRGGSARAVTSDDKGNVSVWDVEQRSRLHRIHAGDRVIRRGLLSPNGSVLLTHSEEGTRLWDVERETRLGELAGHSGSIVAAFSADSRWLATTVADTSFGFEGPPTALRLWSARDGSLVRRLADDVRRPGSIHFSADGASVLVVQMDAVRVWSTATATQVATVREPLVTLADNPESGGPLISRVVEILYADFSPDGRQIVTTAENGVVHLWDAASGRSRRVLKGHSAGVRYASFSRDGRLLVTAGEDRTARVWNPASGALFTTLPEPAAAVEHDWRERNAKDGYLPLERDSISMISLSRDGNRIATSHGDGTARVWEIGRSDPRTIVGPETAAAHVTFSPDGRLIASALRDFSIRLWRSDSGANVATLRGHEHEIESLRFSTDGRLILSAAGDKTARLWDAASGRLLRTFECGASTCDASFAGNGLDTVTANYNGRARLMRSPFGGVAETTTEYGGKVLADWSAGHQLVVTTANATATFWDADTGAELERVYGYTAKPLDDQHVTDVVFSGTGATMITLESEFGRIRDPRLWDVQAARVRAELSGHTTVVRSALFSPDSRTIATVCDDAVRLWDGETGHQAHLLADDMPIMLAVFSRDSKRLATASARGAVRLWDVATGESLDALTIPRGRISDVAFDGEGERLAIAGDRGITMWQLLPSGHRLIQLAVERGVRDD